MKGKNNIFLEGEEGHPQQLFARATFSKSIFICKGWILKKKYWKDEDFEEAMTRRQGECGSDEILLFLDFLPSFRS